MNPVEAIFRAIIFEFKVIFWIFRGIYRLFTFWQSRRPKKPVPFFLSRESRFEHTHIVAGSGHGKTQLIQHLFETQDLAYLPTGRHTVILIDSQGDMIQKILHLKELSPIREQTVRQEQKVAVKAQDKPEQKPKLEQEVAIQVQDKPAVQEQEKPAVESPPAKRTAWSRVGHVSLVVLAHGLELALGPFMGFILRDTQLSIDSRNAIGVAVLAVFGIIAGAWLRLGPFAPTYTEALVGALVFFGIVLALSQQTDAIYASLFISFTLAIGYLLIPFVFSLFRRKTGTSYVPTSTVSTRSVSSPAVSSPVKERRKGGESEPKPESKPTLADRLIYIDPSDVDNPPCLNLFDFGLDRIKDYSPADRERFVNGAIALYEYMFGALLGAELTNRQGVIFRYLARLLMVVPGATIYTLMDFMENPEAARAYLPKLDLASQRFFTTQFFSSAFDNTRQQILTRLWGVLSNNVLARMFSHQQNKLNIFEAMNNGSLILVNTAKDLLEQEGCEIFGRFMIALISQATQERAALGERQRLPTFVYIDEAQDYFDESLEQFLNTARKYRVGLILAHQNLDQFDRKLRSTVLSSTAVKFAGGVSDDDAGKLAKEMHCEPEFIKEAKKGAAQTQFALYVRNDTPAAIGFVVPLGLLERRPRMGDEEYETLLHKNRERYCAPYQRELLEGSQALASAGVSFDLAEHRAL